MGFIIAGDILLKYIPEMDEYEVTIPGRVKEIAKDAFRDSKNLFKVEIPGTVKTIGEYAFCGCKKLRSVSIGNGVENIEEGAFSECHSLRKIKIPQSVYKICASAFSHCSHLAEVDIADGVVVIGSMAFDNCSKLGKVNMPDSINTIDDSAFYGCVELIDVFIPKNIQYIGEEAFSNCTKLHSIRVDERNETYYITENALLTKDNIRLIKYFGTDTEYTAPDGVMIIYPSAFEGGRTLRAISLPDTVIEINEAAFSGCTHLEKMTIPDRVSHIKQSTFKNCYNLKSITLPQNLLRISDCVFDKCDSLEAAEIPNGTVMIAVWAFYKCKNLKRVYIPKSVKFIGKDTFYKCSDFIIITPKGSYAEKYAQENNIIVRTLQVYEDVNMTSDNRSRSELQLHTNMSEMSAIGQIEDYILFAKKNGINAVAVTDSTNVRVFPEAYQYAVKYGVKLIYGTEGYLDNGTDMPYHITVLAKNKTGLKSLYEIVSASYTEFFDKQPFIPKRLLEQKRENLIIGSACGMGELYQAIVTGKDDSTLKEIASFYDYLEVQPFNNKNINKKIVDLGKKMNIPVVATSDAHYVYPKDQIAMKVLVSVKDYDECEKLPPMHIRTTEDMIKAFDYLGYDKAFEITVINTNLIADMIDDTFKPIPSGKHYPVIECSACHNGLTASDIEIRTSEETREIFIDYLKKKFGENNVVYAGEVRPISGILINYYISQYQELTGKTLDEEEKDRIFGLLRKVTRTTGTLPGGMFILPAEGDINDFTPIQCARNAPGDPPATHFDYKYLKDCLYKITILIK